MALNDKQKKIFLALLLVILAVVLLTQAGNLKEIFNLGGRPALDANLTAPSPNSGLQALTQNENFPEIRMDLLDQRTKLSSRPERDPFDFGTDRNSEEQMRLAQERADQARKIQEEQKAQEEPAAPPPPEIKIKFAGYAKRGGEAMAVFIDDKEIIIGKEGEVINDDFIIKKISYESIIMGYVNFADQSSEIPMKGS